LRDAANLAMKLGVTHRFFREQLDDQCGPFVRNPIEDEARRTLGIQDGSRGGAFGHDVF